jgi:hypothetical protein
MYILKLEKFFTQFNHIVQFIKFPLDNDYITPD